VPRRKAKPQEPEVERLFDMLWATLEDAVDDPVVLDYVPPVLTEKALRTLESELADVITDELYEALSDDLCDHGFYIPDLFADYVVTGDPPAWEDIEYAVSEVMEGCGERESIDEFVACVNDAYDCYKLAGKFFNALPMMLRVETVVPEGIAPSICNENRVDVPVEEFMEMVEWHLGWALTSENAIDKWYGLKDGRVVWVGRDNTGYRCAEYLTVPSWMTDELRKIAFRPDLIVHVYGRPPIDPKAISKTIPVRVLSKPPEP
jgi:hypothetical protein